MAEYGSRRSNKRPTAHRRSERLHRRGRACSRDPGTTRSEWVVAVAVGALFFDVDALGDTGFPVWVMNVHEVEIDEERRARRSVL